MDASTETLEGKRILIVEDEYHLAQDMAADFAAAGAVVVGPIPNLRKALGLIQMGETIDAAVLDINLGGDLVYPVADALLVLEVPFVFATGYDRSQIPDRFQTVVLITKPVEVEAVRAVLFAR